MATDTLAQPLPALESWRSDQAPATAALFSAGEGARNLSAGRGRERSPRYRAALSEAMRLHERVLSGNRRASLDFSEAMSTSDFPILFGDILDRQLLGYYRVQPIKWDLTVRRGRVMDFRTVKRYTSDGAESVLDIVPELTNYPAAALSEGEYEYHVTKRGRRVPMSWEVRVNDDLDAFGRIPERLALAARRSEEHYATSLFVGAGGPNATFFSVGHANILTGNAALTITSLQAALTTLNTQTDADGAPIYIGEYVLEVPPALEVVANNLVNAVQIWSANGGGDGTGNDQLQVSNWLAGRLKVKVNPWLPIIDQTGNKNSTWYVWASPGEGRPAMEIGFLIGHEAPELFMKSPNAIRVGGGGLVDPMAGDFDSDALEYKIRHVFGGTLMDYKMAIVSNGSGS
jgi:hypothetical protein